MSTDELKALWDNEDFKQKFQFDPTRTMVGYVLAWQQNIHNRKIEQFLNGEIDCL